MLKRTAGLRDYNSNEGVFPPISKKWSWQLPQHDYPISEPAQQMLSEAEFSPRLVNWQWTVEDIPLKSGHRELKTKAADSSAPNWSFFNQIY